MSLPKFPPGRGRAYVLKKGTQLDFFKARADYCGLLTRVVGTNEERTTAGLLGRCIVNGGESGYHWTWAGKNSAISSS